MNIYWFLLGVLAVWRVTHLVQGEDGPWKVFLRLRWVAGRGFWGDLVNCFHCVSLWVALPAACLLGRRWVERVFLWLAFSGGAILLQRVSRREYASPPALYYEDKEDDHAVLRGPEEPVRDR